MTVSIEYLCSIVRQELHVLGTSLEMIADEAIK